MEHREADERQRSHWPVIIVGALAVFGAITLVQWVIGFAFGLAKLLIVLAIIAVGVLFFRGPPDGK